MVGNDHRGSDATGWPAASVAPKFPRLATTAGRGASQGLVLDDPQSILIFPDVLL